MLLAVGLSYMTSIMLKYVPFIEESRENHYTVEVRNRFKGLDLIDRVSDELWTEVGDTVHETGIKTIPWKRNVKKQNGCPGRPYK